MKWQGIVLTIVTLLILLAGIALFVIPAKAPTVSVGDQTATTTPQDDWAAHPHKDRSIIIDSIDSKTISNDHPFVISLGEHTFVGRAQANWFFEGTFPVEVVTASGTVVWQGQAHATSDWTKGGLIPFTVNLDGPRRADLNGTSAKVIFKKDNPSGLPQNDDQFVLPGFLGYAG